MWSWICIVLAKSSLEIIAFWCHIYVNFLFKFASNRSCFRTNFLCNKTCLYIVLKIYIFFMFAQNHLYNMYLFGGDREREIFWFLFEPSKHFLSWMTTVKFFDIFRVYYAISCDVFVTLNCLLQVQMHRPGWKWDSDTEWAAILLWGAVASNGMHGPRACALWGYFVPNNWHDWTWGSIFPLFFFYWWFCFPSWMLGFVWEHFLRETTSNSH